MIEKVLYCLVCAHRLMVKMLLCTIRRVRAHLEHTAVDATFGQWGCVQMTRELCAKA